jgi:hypothetical protein
MMRRGRLAGDGEGTNPVCRRRREGNGGEKEGGEKGVKGEGEWRGETKWEGRREKGIERRRQGIAEKVEKTGWIKGLRWEERNEYYVKEHWKVRS